MLLTSTATFTVADAATAVATTTLVVLPSVSFPSGQGRLIHPTLGTFDYDVKPDEWTNIDGAPIIPPTWSSVKTLGGSANVVWSGFLRDVVCEERWKSLGGLSMPVAQFRMLYMIWTTPVDPSVGYVQWYPNYTSVNGYNVLPMALTSGGKDIVFDDVINAKNEDGSPNGWMTNPIVLTLKLVGQI